MKVLILGGTGMLGSMVAKVLPDEWEVLVTARTPAPYPYELVNARWRRFEVGVPSWQNDLRELAEGYDWIVNCLGATKPLMGEAAAVACNAHLPKELSALGPAVIHASTDCVFSGKGGAPYNEHVHADATDGYGQSKAAADPSGLVTLRCSIIGPECRSPARYLLGRTLEGHVSKGWTDHCWNGLTTLAWARIATAIMEHPECVEPGGLHRPALLHLVPQDSCSKDRLVRTILQAHGRVHPVESVVSGNPTDTRLDTAYTNRLQQLWRLAGYGVVPPRDRGFLVNQLQRLWSGADATPTIEEMIDEQAEFCRAELWPPSGVDGWRYWRR